MFVETMFLITIFLNQKNPHGGLSGGNASQIIFGHPVGHSTNVQFALEGKLAQVWSPAIHRDVDKLKTPHATLPKKNSWIQPFAACTKLYVIVCTAFS